MNKRATVESTADAYLELLGRARRRILLRERGHRLRPAHRGLRAAQRAGPGEPAPHHGPARGAGGGDGARLRHGHRPRPGGDGPRHRGRGQRGGRGDQRGALQRADAVLGRAQPDHRGGRRGQPRPAHPLGAGGLRPGRDAARVREVGLRAEALRPARDGGGPRADRGPVRAAGAGLSDIAARGAGRAARGHRVLGRSRAGGGRRPATAAGPGAVDEAAAMLAGARNPIIITKAAGARSARGAGAGDVSPRRSARRSSTSSTPT